MKEGKLADSEKSEGGEKKSPPRVTVGNRGDMGSTVEMIPDELREKNPEKAYRFVYMPEHKSDYSQLAKRRAQGYSPVDPEAEGVEPPHGKAGGQIRVGDVVLMEVDKDTKEQRQAELNKRAKEDARRAQEVYEENVRRTGRGGEGARPVGDISRQDRVYSVEMEE